MCLPTLLPWRPVAVGADPTARGVNLQCGASWCCVQSSLPCVGTADMGSGSIPMAMGMQVFAVKPFLQKRLRTGHTVKRKTPRPSFYKGAARIKVRT